VNETTRSKAITAAIRMSELPPTDGPSRPGNRGATEGGCRGPYPFSILLVVGIETQERE
jgi:hypothetical protein